MKPCDCCDGSMTIFMTLEPYTSFWVCYKCRKIFIEDENGVMSDYEIKSHYPQRLSLALNNH